MAKQQHGDEGAEQEPRDPHYVGFRAEAPLYADLEAEQKRMADSLGIRLSLAQVVSSLLREALSLRKAVLRDGKGKKS